MVIAIGILTIRTALEVIHSAVNSNMTRALDEVTQLHRDVTQLIKERNEARVEMSGMKSEERLAGRLVVVVDDIAAQQQVVASDLAVAQKAVEGVASDLADSHQRADDVAHDEPAGTAADAASKLPDKEN